MNRLKLTKAEARNYLIHYHGLDSSCSFSGEKGILEYIKRVGCIQFDPLNVVGRNPDLVLQARIQDYSPKMLEKLLYKDRTLIDGWDKMMAIYMQEDWPFFRRLRSRKEKEVIATLRNRGQLEALELIDDIRDIIRQQGPTQSAKIGLGKGNEAKWGHRKLSSAAMDYMFNIGELGIYCKKNTQKVYDLIERLLPSELTANEDPFTSDREFYKWYFKRRIGSVGLLWGRNGGGWLGHFLSDRELRESVLGELVEEESVICLTIHGIDEIFYMRAEDIPVLEAMEQVKEPAMRFLAPLDNLLWDRDMLVRIFDFQYSWEVYVPKEKRKYGYYVLPVLYDNKLVARFEPELYRNIEILNIKDWWWEEGVKVTEDMKCALEKCLQVFCQYLQVCNDGKDNILELIEGICK